METHTVDQIVRTPSKVRHFLRNVDCGTSPVFMMAVSDSGLEVVSQYRESHLRMNVEWDDLHELFRRR